MLNEKRSEEKTEPGEPRFKKARIIKSKLDCLLITFFDVKGLVHYEFVPEGQTINQHYYLDVLRRLREAVRQKRPEKWHQKNWLLHHDNARPHKAVTIQLYLAKHGIALLSQPPYSLELAPNDFFLYPKIKKVLKGRQFDSIPEIKENTKNILKGLKDDDFQRCFDIWKKRWNKCIHSDDTGVAEIYDPCFWRCSPPVTCPWIFSLALRYRPPSRGNEVDQCGEGYHLPVLSWFNKAGTINDLERSGRPRVQRTQAAIKAIRERIRRNQRRKQKILAKQMNIAPRTVSRIINEDLGLRVFKRRTGHLIIPALRDIRRNCRYNSQAAPPDGDRLKLAAPPLLTLGRRVSHSMMQQKNTLSEDCGVNNLSTPISTVSMPRRKIRAHYEQMSEFETGRAIGLKEAGWSNRLIARHLCRSDAAIRRCWQKWVNNGSMQRQDGSGRPRATTEREDRAIVRMAVAARESTLSTNQRVTGTQVSKMTINRRLRERNLRARRPLRCLPLTPVHRQVRLQWCRERSTWNCAD
ncbi:hypothetical protein LAZ67_8002960 [Cordylochernes scorpioides]|uniref:Transposase Tc1-like domain-containing protein n=1 Tax=Cordylochernes scorpioides TaxID=51811 RepID=A0ABY6KS04_9ARAC|nr:hypothetical protein LAZ67_8002960 [Cordylochernes scorpioides]